MNGAKAARHGSGRGHPELSDAERNSVHEFNNIFFEWRRLFGELFGTFLLVLAAAGGSLVDTVSGGAVGPAAAVLRGIFGSQGDNGATVPGPGFTDPQCLAIEILLTMGLVSTILGGASGAQNVGMLSAFAVGAYIILAGLWAGPVSGASMNPARTLGPDLVRGDVTHTWIYVTGPLIGALLAVGIAYILRGPGGGPTGRKAAQGTLP